VSSGSDLHELLLGKCGETPNSFQCAKKLSELSVNTKPLTVEHAAKEKKKKKKENDIAMLTVQDKNSCQK
jgi:hypothetical protein